MLASNKNGFGFLVIVVGVLWRGGDLLVSWNVPWLQRWGWLRGIRDSVASHGPLPHIPL